MKTKKKCEVCSKRFEATRSDSKYCSGVCKQKAYYLRAKATNISTDVKLEFNHSEYDAVLDECGLMYEDLPFVVYCYQRRTLTGNPSIEQISNFINSLRLEKHDILRLKSFQIFQDNFFSNEYIINV